MEIKTFASALAAVASIKEKVYIHLVAFDDFFSDATVKRAEAFCETVPSGQYILDCGRKNGERKFIFFKKENE